MWKKNKEQGNIIYIFRFDSLCECYDLPRILNFTGHVASSSSPKSVGQVVFVVFVLLFTTLFLSSSKFKLPAVIFLISCPFRGAPFLFKSKKLCVLNPLAWLLARRILWLVVMPSVCRSWKSERVCWSPGVWGTAKVSYQPQVAKVVSSVYALRRARERGRGTGDFYGRGK